MKLSNKIIIIIMSTICGFIIGSSYKNIFSGSKIAIISIPYFDLLLSDGKYSDIENDYRSLMKTYTPEYRAIFEKISKNTNISNYLFEKVISSVKVDKNNGQIIITTPFYFFISNSDFDYLVNSLIDHLNSTSSNKFKKINDLLARKEVLLTKSNNSDLKNSTILLPRIPLSVAEIELMMNEIKELQNILSKYSENSYIVEHKNVHNIFSISSESFKFSLIFLLISSFFLFKNFRNKLLF